MRLLLPTLLLLCLFSSCRLIGGKRVKGNGRVETRELSINDFQNVDVEGGMTVRLRQDPGYRVRVETDANLFEYLEVYRDGSALVVKPRSGYRLRPSRGVTVYASAPRFREINASGSCEVTTENVLSGSDIDLAGSGSVNMRVAVDVPSLQASLSGSGEAEIRGAARRFEGRLSGSGNIRAGGLVTDDAELDLSGSADAEITANRRLDVEISGSGSVVYRGNPEVQQRVSGSGSIRRLQ